MVRVTVARSRVHRRTMVRTRVTRRCSVSQTRVSTEARAWTTVIRRRVVRVYAYALTGGSDSSVTCKLPAVAI